MSGRQPAGYRLLARFEGLDPTTDSAQGLPGVQCAAHALCGCKLCIDVCCLRVTDLTGAQSDLCVFLATGPCIASVVTYTGSVRGAAMYFPRSRATA